MNGVWGLLDGFPALILPAPDALWGGRLRVGGACILVIVGEGKEGLGGGRPVEGAPIAPLSLPSLLSHALLYAF